MFAPRPLTPEVRLHTSDTPVPPMPAIGPTGEPLRTRTSGAPPLGHPALSCDFVFVQFESVGVAAPGAVRKTRMGD